MTYRRILVAVDDSKTSQLAFKEAVKLAKACQAKLCILHVIEKLPHHIAYAIDIKKFQIIANKNATALLNKFKQAAIKEKISVETKLVDIIDYKISISKKITQVNKSWKADLLVIGTHGRTGFSRFMLGSVAEELLKTSIIPLLIVRSK